MQLAREWQRRRKSGLWAPSHLTDDVSGPAVCVPPMGASMPLYRPPSGLTAFTNPLDAATTCALWLRADLGVTTGGQTTTWGDQSGNARDYTSIGTAPATSTLGGQTCFSFNVTGFFVGPSFSGILTTGEIFVIYRQTNDPPTGGDAHTGFWRFGSESGAVNSAPYSDGKFYEGFGTTLRKDVISHSAVLTNTTIYNVMSKSGGYRMTLNGTEDIYTSASNTTGWSATGTMLGAGAASYTTSPTYYFDGKIAELVIYAGELSTTDRARLILYFRARYTGIP